MNYKFITLPALLCIHSFVFSMKITEKPVSKMEITEKPVSKYERYNELSKTVNEDKKNNVPLSFHTVIQQTKACQRILSTDPVTDNDKKFNAKINTIIGDRLKKLEEHKILLVDRYIHLQKETMNNMSLISFYTKLKNETHMFDSEQDMFVKTTFIERLQKCIPPLNSIIGNDTLMEEMQRSIDKQVLSIKNSTSESSSTQNDNNDYNNFFQESLHILSTPFSTHEKEIRNTVIQFIDKKINSTDNK